MMTECSVFVATYPGAESAQADYELVDDATLERHCELWEQKTGVRVSISAMSRAIREKLGWSYKKRHWVPPSRNEEARSSFRERLRGVDASRLLFVDESSTNVALTPRYARDARTVIERR